ncbi:hypothetical protein GJT88_02315 (plasmid) [Enterobacteriaceae endosymbiont of Donacia tomentosa]|uniref:prephenate dehydratase domain-containing protein n=1 Tax=Enterobacteriaceae endosymbiont of Donacia tomentosa TaxID=2675787 RepID=UPI001448DA23|nr:prephenate dehydratase domain-containing protein [Enterobacteriaceae endosymbiont of Donacia tomentosa]QJC31889.1 hypothetical protein GJT88_02315 [Enterobacteriaceae endosymbiont of Donacia tomentosa]
MIKKKIYSDILTSQVNCVLNYNSIDFIKKNKNTLISLAFLGPVGSYSHLASLTYINNFFYKKKIINISCNTFEEIFYYVEKDYITQAIVPISNNYSGLIKEVYILLKKSSLYIKEKFAIPIKHCLVTRTNFFIKNIKTILSHPQPFEQCSFFIKKYPHWEIENCNSSAYAMKIIKKNKSKYLAAIGNELAAKFYNLNIVKNNISNKINNETIFLVLIKK